MMKRSRSDHALGIFLLEIPPTPPNVEGLIDCLGHTMGRLAIDLHQRDTVLKVQDKPALVGGGTDGASVNIGVHNAMKAQMQSMFPWLFWAWCFSHRLKLACKDAFTSSLFTEISETQLRLYYLYDNFPRSQRSLQALEKISKRSVASPKEEICQFKAKELGGPSTSSKPFNESWITLEPMSHTSQPL